MDLINEDLPVKGLCFDKDGTLFDFAATWEAWAAAFLDRVSKGDRERAQRLGAAIGYDTAKGKFAKDSIVIAGTPNEVATALAPQFPDQPISEVVKMLNEEAGRAPQKEAVPLVPLLNAFRNNGLFLGVATNDAEAPARAHLAAAGVTDLFDFIAGYDSGYGGKPAAGQLLAFADHVKLKPSQIAMVGDSTHDLHAGRAAGMRTVAVLTGTAGAQELAPFADVVLDDIGGIPEWLATL
ncbi:HAD family hydrolase [Sulfitobacter donghicola]|uniref:phosphoglycolate phosphatase n=1 Tax=Sulfitobacter donghicola DSW-25 = KCTC 12864 = JCM 14565 TaxID=1300350 RepID=A0A073II52_9RHOB|nr:phosphatase [Sulfitobacter donghicola DSW-25 = KCTC 12864 = JCM 14565]KIN69040.1 HAD-superfamily hydrolase, subfamily IA, variant 1 family protein [Sulfitobacter donghicola DSW-25 = KCTC 12864 = JCM 14565]